MVFKIHIIGHSYVHHFKTFIRRNSDQFSYNLNLDPKQVMIQYSASPGASVPQLRDRHIQYVQDFEPDIVILDIGTNDLCNKHLTAEALVASLLDLVDHLIYFRNVKFVVVLQILHRVPSLVPIRHPVDIVWFDDRVDEVNLSLTKKLQDTSQACFWRHKAFWSVKSQLEVFSRDGIHLSTQGQRKYFSSLRALVVHLLNRLDKTK